MNDEKLSELHCEVQQHSDQLRQQAIELQKCNGECKRLAAENDHLKASLIELRTMLEDTRYH